MLWSLCGSKDNSYPPYLVTMDWLWECFITNTKVDESKFIPRESDKYEIRRKKINKQGTIFKETVFCFDTSSYTPEDLDYYETLIFQNGGNVIDENIENSNASIMIHNDGGSKIPEDVNYYYVEESKINKKHNWSHWYILKCLNAKQKISLWKSWALYLNPLKFKIPL